MKRNHASQLLVMMLAVYLISGAVARAEESHILLTATDLKWAVGPFPGTQAAVLEGDPKSPGAFSMRLKLPADYKIPPHWHPGHERVTVISGTFNVGQGDRFDSSKGKVLPAGSFMLMPPKTNHFAWVKEETIIQINGIGPWALNFLNAEDDPRRK
jgi:quercetin dioxygenase-like cupin family protein